MMRRLSPLLLIVYSVLTLYSTARIILDLPSLPYFTPMLTVLAFCFAWLHGKERLGWLRATLLLLITFGVSLLFESLGVATGLVYGPYHYTDKLGPMFLGLVPYLIPIAWFMMTYPSLVIAESLLPNPSRSWPTMLATAGLGAVIMTSWDVAMDPMMVAGKHWVWDVNGAFFGVPLQNYWGWWLTIFVTFVLYYTLSRRTSRAPAITDGSFDRLAVISYAVTALNTVATAYTIGLGGPALAGLFAVLPWIVVGWRRLT